MKNGVINTDQWLDEHFYEPTELCKRILQENRKDEASHQQNNPNHFYRYIQKFGMYKPTRQANSTIEKLKQQNVWNDVKVIFNKYRKKWSGPEIPVYIFPLAERLGLFQRTASNKSGVSFHDKLFLFLTPDLTVTEIQALFVHEYHHVCRLNHIKKGIHNYTLLDSMILEGLAEAAVEANCGKEYLAPWCNLYSDKEISQYWNKYLKKNLSVKKDQSLHDSLLFGERGYPKMLGYATGYKLVEKYKTISVQDSFLIKAEEFLKNEFNNN